MNDATYYWHAGVAAGPVGPVLRWSDRTRRSFQAAAREALAMARNDGWPIVEYWRRQHGLRPRDAGVVRGAIQGPVVRALLTSGPEKE